MGRESLVLVSIYSNGLLFYHSASVVKDSEAAQQLNVRFPIFLGYVELTVCGNFAIACRNDSELDSKMATPRTSWTMTGCGLLGGYYLGVWNALSRPNVPRALFDARASRIHGASAGALVGAAIVSGVSHADTTDAFERIAEAVRPVGLLCCPILAIIRTEAEKLLPEDAHELATGRLSVLATDAGAAPFLNMKKQTFDAFDSRASLIDAVLVSSYLPGLMSRPRLTTPLHERNLIDGGIWSFEAAEGERLISVSPFGGAFDVSPTSQATDGRWLRWPMVRVGMGWLDASPDNLANGWRAFSPAAELDDLYRRGFDDCERFLRHECPGLVLAPYADPRRRTASNEAGPG